MDILPDFSESKLQIRNRIEGALREKKRGPSLYQYSMFLCLFFFTSLCTAIYIKNIITGKTQSNKRDIDYFVMEQFLSSEGFDQETVIELPRTLSLSSAGESTLFSTISFAQETYE